MFGAHIIMFGAFLILGPSLLSEGELQELEDQNRDANVPVDFDNLTMYEQILHYSKQATSTALHHRFDWLPTEQDVDNALKKMHKAYTKKFKDVSLIITKQKHYI